MHALPYRSWTAKPARPVLATPEQGPEEYPCPDCGEPTIRSFCSELQWVHTSGLVAQRCREIRRHAHPSTTYGHASTPSTAAGSQPHVLA